MKYIRIILIFNLFLVQKYLIAQNHAAFVSNPSAYQTGIPDISQSLFQINASKNLNVNLNLDYNPNSYSYKDSQGTIGNGWNLAGSIYKISWVNSSSEFDEQNNLYNSYDIYAYSIGSENGYFKVLHKRDISNNTTVLISILSNSQVKVTFELDRFSNYNYKKIFKSFTLIDSNGTKYIFNDYNQQRVPLNNININDDRKEFQISSIVDLTNREVVKYSYIKIQKPNNQNNPKINLIKEIITDTGKINFVYDEEENNNFDFYDKKKVKYIQLLNDRNNVITYYELVYSNASKTFYDLFNIYDNYKKKLVDFRFLSKLIKKDRESNIIEQTLFSYENNPKNINNNLSIWWEEPSELWNSAIRFDDPKKLLYGVLTSIRLPTGGTIRYEFEPNRIESHINKNSQEYINKIKDPFQFTDPEVEYIDSKFYDEEHTAYIDFDTNISRRYYINDLKNTDPYVRIYVQFQIGEKYPINIGGGSTISNLSPPIGQTPFVKYTVKGALNSDDLAYDEHLTGKFYVVPNDGSAYIELTGGGNGFIYILEKMYTSFPLKNEITSAYSGVRIKKIEYYDKSNDFNSALLKSTSFDYDYFDKPGISSGIGIGDFNNGSIIYKNVKVSESDTNGYTKYYFKTPYDIETLPHPSINTRTVHPLYEAYKKGVLYKEEIFNSNNKLLQKIDINLNYRYNEQDIYQLGYQSVFWNIEPYYSFEQLGWPELIYSVSHDLDKITTKMTSYDDYNNEMVTVSEKIFDNSSKNIKQEKMFYPDGTTKEVIYEYAQDKNVEKLLLANINSIPLSTTHKINGKTIGYIEMEFNNLDNLFPSKISKYGLNNVLKSQEINILYDEFGNVLQSNTKTGFPTTYIYGYNGTLLIAEIGGATYAEVMQAFGLSSNINEYKNLEIVQFSNQDIDEESEIVLQQKLDQFRLKSNFKDFMITTYTYDPLIGIRSMTTASGSKEFYYYNKAANLIRIEDINHNILNEFKYNNNSQP